MKKEVTASQACRRLGITLDALYRLLYAGKLAGRKVEGVWRIRATDVEARRRTREASSRASYQLAKELQVGADNAKH